MLILPVLDLLGGIVVHGMGGDRANYRPIRSTLTNSIKPIEVAHAIAEHFGLRKFYIADLDAIQTGTRNNAIYDDFLANDFELILDLGIVDSEDIEKVVNHPRASLVVASETLRSSTDLAEILTVIAPADVVFSLDLQNCKPLVQNPDWLEKTAMEVVEDVRQQGVKRIIILDLSNVGSNAGVGTLSLCHEILEQYPEMKIITGGGIRHCADLTTLAAVNIHGVLLATALHNGSLSKEELKAFASPDT